MRPKKKGECAKRKVCGKRQIEHLETKIYRTLPDVSRLALKVMVMIWQEAEGKKFFDNFTFRYILMIY